MQSRTKQHTGRRVRRKKKVSRAHKPRGQVMARRRTAGALMAGCVFLILLGLVLYLLVPFLTREKILTLDTNGRLWVQDQPQRFERAVE